MRGMRRWDYWKRMLFAPVVLSIVGMLFKNSMLLIPYFILSILAIVVLNFIWGFQRIEDAGLSGYLELLIFLPIVGWIIVFGIKLFPTDYFIKDKNVTDDLEPKVSMIDRIKNKVGGIQSKPVMSIEDLLNEDDIDTEKADVVDEPVEYVPQKPIKQPKKSSKTANPPRGMGL